jgi:hypothetical protein
VQLPRTKFGPRQKEMTSSRLSQLIQRLAIRRVLRSTEEYDPIYVEIAAVSNAALTSYCAQKWASNEQKGMSAASAAVAEAMAKGNQDYESKMGFR